jgi:hypothetical protein
MTEFGAKELERVLIDALSPIPETTLIDRPDWVQLITPGRREANLNCVVLARLEPEDADRRVAEVVQGYRDLGVPMRWIVGPSSTPNDLSARLVAAGVPVIAAALGMHMRVPDEVPALPAGLSFRRVGLDDAVLFAETDTRGWQRGEEFRHECEAAVRRAVARPDQCMRSWLVERDGEAIGAFNLRLLDGVGYFQGASIVPEHRRKGVYRAAIHHRLATLRELGIEHAVIWADETTSAGVCRRAGFEPKCKAIFHHRSV